MALGKTLREARERRQLTLSQVAAATRMKVQVAQALEAEDYRKMPAPIYGRGFIRMYAEFVGVDPKPLVAEYMAVVSRPADQSVSPSQASGSGTPQKPTPPTRSPLTKMTPVPRKPHQLGPGVVRPEPIPEVTFAPTPVSVATSRPHPVPPAPVVTPPEPEPPPPPPPPPSPTPSPAPVPPPPVPEPVPVAETLPLQKPEPELKPEPEREPESLVAPAVAQPKEDDLFVWSQTTAVVPQAHVEPVAPPPEPEPEPEPIQSPVQSEPAPQPDQDDVAPVETASTGEISDDPEYPVQAEPESVSPAAPAPRQEEDDDLLSVADTPAFVRPPKTILGPQSASYERRPLQRPEPGEEPTLSSERQALKTRAVMVMIGVGVVAIFLISALSRCSAPPKEIKRGPIKEQLKMAVEPPAPYVD